MITGIDVQDLGGGKVEVAAIDRKPLSPKAGIPSHHGQLEPEAGTRCGFPAVAAVHQDWPALRVRSFKPI